MFSNEKTSLLNPLDWAEVALSTPDERQLEAWLEYRSDALGFETMSLSLGLSRRDPAIPARDQIFGSLVSPAWHDYYYRNSHLMRHDPMAKYLFSDETPVTFRADTPPPISISATEEWKFLQRVIDFGMWGTLAFSFFGRANGTVSIFVSATSFDNAEFVHTSEKHVSQLQLAAEYFVEGIHLRKHGPGDLNGSLSPRERECLLWASVGKTTKEIADRLSLTDYTVDSYIAAAKRKLGCTTRTQACMRAILLEQIAP